jgi:hypothetical protein
MGGQDAAFQADIHASKFDDPLKRADQLHAASNVSQLRFWGLVKFQMARCLEWHLCLHLPHLWVVFLIQALIFPSGCGVHHAKASSSAMLQASANLAV